MSEQTYRPTTGFRYQFPYRIMVPKAVDNLLVAGRCVSVTHEALGSIRVMLTCMVMGEAAGAAAMLSLREEVPPRELPLDVLQARLEAQGVILGEDHVVGGLPDWGADG
jgi:hypothetical protein